MATNTKEAPRPGPVSVDFNELHQQCKSGAQSESALDKAVFAETVAEPEGAAAAPAGDALDDMQKADLQERARSLGIKFESDANMERLKELLRAHPEGVPAPANPDLITSEPVADQA
jgi:hypothetical protein